MRIAWTDGLLFACTYSPRHPDLALDGVARTVTVNTSDAVSVPMTNCDSPVSTLLITPAGPWRVIDQFCMGWIYQSLLDDAAAKCL